MDNKLQMIITALKSIGMNEDEISCKLMILVPENRKKNILLSNSIIIELRKTLKEIGYTAWLTDDLLSEITKLEVNYIHKIIHAK